MTAQPLESGASVPRTYKSISSALSVELVEQFTEEWHETDPFSAARVLESWGRLADEATYAAVQRCVPEVTGVNLAEVLAEVER